jgi:MFS superfamily sulfate permease-like transporter
MDHLATEGDASCWPDVSEKRPCSTSLGVRRCRAECDYCATMNLTPVALRGYQKSWLSRDVIAGITLAAVAIPEVMGYTSIAETPIQTGLYTVIFPTLLFALLGSSKLLVVGADSATAAVLAAGLAGLGVAGLTPYSEEWVAYCSLTALVVGGLLLLARVLKLGFIGDFLSTSVLVGFLTGVGIQVLSGQIPDMLGVPKGSGNWFQQQWEMIQSIPDANLTTVGFSVLTVGLIILFDKFIPKVPGALVAVVLCIIISTVIDATADGVAVVGAVPSGAPPVGLPQGVSLSDVWLVLPTAFSCFVLIVAQSAATSRSFAAKHGDRVDVNRDIVGLSGASFAAGLSGTFVVNGSPTKTQILDQQRGRTQVANMTMSAVVLLFALFFTSLLTNMPKATLAGIVFMIGVSLIDAPGLKKTNRERFSEFVIACLTGFVVFGVGVEQGIILAIVASILEIIRRAYSPKDFVVVQDADGTPTYLAAEAGAQSAPGLIVFRFDAELFYANAGRFCDDVKALVDGAPDPVRWVLLDASSLTDVDYSAGIQLKDLGEFLVSRGIHVGLVRADDDMIATLHTYEVLGGESPTTTYPTMDAGLAAFQADQGATR